MSMDTINEVASSEGEQVKEENTTNTASVSSVDAKNATNQNDSTASNSTDNTDHNIPRLEPVFSNGNVITDKSKGKTDDTRPIASMPEAASSEDFTDSSTSQFIASESPPLNDNGLASQKCQKESEPLTDTESPQREYSKAILPQTEPDSGTVQKESVNPIPLKRTVQKSASSLVTSEPVTEHDNLAFTTEDEDDQPVNV